MFQFLCVFSVWDCKLGTTALLTSAYCENKHHDKVPRDWDGKSHTKALSDILGSVPGLTIVFTPQSAHPQHGCVTQTQVICQFQCNHVK